jgi:hypothetical protein
VRHRRRTPASSRPEGSAAYTLIRRGPDGQPRQESFPHAAAYRARLVALPLSIERSFSIDEIAQLLDTLQAAPTAEPQVSSPRSPRSIGRVGTRMGKQISASLAAKPRARHAVYTAAEPSQILDVRTRTSRTRHRDGARRQLG